MLLKLEEPSRIEPVALPDCRGPLHFGASVQMAGYGVTRMGSYNQRIPGVSGTLQCVSLTVVDPKPLCRIMSQLNPRRQNQFWFSVESPGKDTCPGDSGGGMVYQDRIYGVHAFTGDPMRACSAAAGVMDVCGYIGWIRNTISSSK